MFGQPFDVLIEVNVIWNDSFYQYAFFRDIKQSNIGRSARKIVEHNDISINPL